MDDAAAPMVLGYQLDGEGNAEAVPFDAPAGPGFVWRHLNWLASEGSAWLHGPDGPGEEVLEALLAPETRPRCTLYSAAGRTGVFINLRGVNLNEGASPEDMISIRIWLLPDQVVSVWRRPLTAIDDLIGGMERGQGPVGPCDLVARLALRLADRAEPVVATLNEAVDAMEEAAIGDVSARSMRGDLAELRRTAIVLRRYMFPQRDALSTLAIEDLDWLSERGRSRLREATDRITRLGEELDAIRERAAVVQDQLIERRAEEMNRHMYLLSIVAAIFLPLGFLTGLLGINVGGMPGAETPWAFWVVCALMIGVTGVEVWLFRRLKLI